jgi:carbamoyl-phosphate synthase large subunit
MNPVNLLLVNVGRRVELLRLFRKAYGDLGLSGRILATDVDPLAPALQEADAHFIIPRVDDGGFVPSLARICRTESVSLVFPLIDSAIPVLARGRAELESAGARVAVVPPEAAERTYDKWKFHEWLRSLGVPAPATWLPQDLPAEPAFPLFVKPRFGSAGRESFRVENADELAFYLPRVQQPVVQAFVDGPEVTNDVFCGLDGEVWAVVSRRRIEVRWGEVHKGVTIRDTGLLETCARMAHALDGVGPITIQCLLQSGRPLFTEINARFAGGMPLAVAAGVPAPLWYLQQAAGGKVTPPPLGTYRQGVYLTRYDDSFFLEGDGYEPLASGGF